MMKPRLACLMLLLATTGAHAGTNDAAATPQKTPSTITIIAHRKLLEYSGPDSFQYATPSDFRYGGLKEAIHDSVVGIPTTPPTTNIPDDRFASERSPYGSLASGGGLRHLLNLLNHGTRVWRDTPQRDTVKLTYHIQGSEPRGDNRMLVQQSKGPDSWVYAEPSDYQYGSSAAAQFYKDVIRSEVVAPQQQQLSSARFEQPPPALRGDKRRLMASDGAAAMAADADEHAPASIKAGAGSNRRLLDGHSGPDSWQYGTPDNFRYGGLNNFVKEAVRTDVVGSAAAIPDSRFARQPGVVSDK